MRPLFSALALVMCGAVAASACGSSPGKKRAISNEGGAGGETGGLAGEGPSEGGAAGAPGGGAPDSAGQGGAPAATMGGLSLPAALKFNIPCGTATAQATLSLTNWGDRDIELASGEVEGAFKLETALPLTIASGETAELVVSTAPGVFGTDAPGDERSGTLTLASNLGTAVVSLDGSFSSTTLELGKVPGAPLNGPLTFLCNSTQAALLCNTQTFTILNTGPSNAVLKPPVGGQRAVAAFIPGSAEPLTLEPGAAVKIEVRPGSGGDFVQVGVTDTIVVPVEGSCDFDEIEVPVIVGKLDACECNQTPPGIEVTSAVSADYACGSDPPTTDLTIFNGSTAPLEVETVSDFDGSLPTATTLPLSVAGGQSELLKLVSPKFPGGAGSFPHNLRLDTDLGAMSSSAIFRASGSALLLRLASNHSIVLPTLPLGDCSPVQLELVNFGNVAAIVSPPVLGGALSISGFDSPKTIEPNAAFVFSVAAVSNTGNACLTDGSLAFTLDNDCIGPSVGRATTYSGSCSCNGL